MAACSGNDSSNENSSTEESGTGGSAGRTGTAGSDRGGASTAGKGATVPTAGRSSSGGLAGRSSGSAGESAIGGFGGISVPPIGRAGSSANVAGRSAGGAGGIAGASAAAGTNAQAGTGGTQAVALSDAQIADVLLTADAGEVQQNMIALNRAMAPSARAFAQDLIDMHTAAQLRLDGLLATLNITPQTSAVNDQLLEASDRIVAKLQNGSDVTFDMTYLQSQIDVHLQVLDLIDHTLLPNAKNEQLRNEIAAVRAEVALHLARARTLAEALNLDVDAGVGGDIDAG